MTKAWEKFEIRCCDHLNIVYNKYANFRRKGGSDSTTSDIECLSKDERFFIESKCPRAQCGQFAVSLMHCRFYFSKKNKTPSTVISDNIINILNDNYSKYSVVSQSAIPIEINQVDCASWIMDYYKSKNVKYIMTTDKSKDYIYVPIDKFSEYFNVNIQLRRKRSGSSKLNNQWRENFLYLFNKRFNCRPTLIQANKYKVDNRMIVGNVKLEGDSKTYQLNSDDGMTFDVRMLGMSNTPTIIFDIELKNPQEPSDFIEFEKDIKKSTPKMLREELAFEKFFKYN